MGSSLRVLYGTGNGDAYGYDEFGRDMHDPEKEETGRYSRQGGKQPFGYTGYRHDEISGTYFAQAREYRAELGRFTAEDVVRGNGAVPQTMNRYSYCWNQPLHFVDGNGEFPWLIVPIVIGATVLSGCGIPEEEVVPMPSPTGDYGFKNSPEDYNSKDLKSFTNCYAYALDIINNPLTGEKFVNENERTLNVAWGAQPGLLSDQYSGEKYSNMLGTTDYSKNLFIQLVNDDVQALGWNLQDVGKDLEGGYFIAIAVDPAIDYHFYRMDNDGSWSDKLGVGKVRIGIENPQIDALKKGYEIFLGYYYLNKNEGCE